MSASTTTMHLDAQRTGVARREIVVGAVVVTAVNAMIWAAGKAADLSFLATPPGQPTSEVSIVLIVLAVLVIVYTALMNNSVFGRHTYAIGGNLHAAELSGVKTKAVTFRLFVNMGVLAALAGLVFTARLNSAQPAGGTGFELDSIAAAFIGGAAVTGGIGTVAGAMIGGLIMGVLNNGMSILGLGTDYQQLIKGLVLLVAVGFDIFNKNRGGGGGARDRHHPLAPGPGDHRGDRAEADALRRRTRGAERPPARAVRDLRRRGGRRRDLRQLRLRLPGAVRGRLRDRRRPDR